MISNRYGVRRQSDPETAQSTSPRSANLATWLSLILLFAGSAAAVAQITNLGHGLAFDGTTEAVVINQGFQGFPSTNLTIELWARSSDNTKNGSLFSYGAGVDPNQFLIYNHRNLQIWINNSATIFTGVSINDGAWHHVAVTWSTSGALQIFKDGSLAFSTNHAAGVQLASGGTLVLGQDQDAIGGGFDPAQAFLGDMDEVRLWSVVRTPLQIAQSATNLLVGNEAGLVAYYRMNEGISTNTADGTSLGHNCTLRSGVSWLPHAPYNAGTALNLTNGFVSIPHSPSLNAYPIAITAWLRTTSTQALDVVVSKYTEVEPSEGEPNGYQLFLVNGSLSAFYFLNGSQRVDFRAFGTNAGPVNDGLWHHVAFTVDNTGGRLYVDGALRGTRVWQSSPGPIITTNALTIGRSGANGFLGQVDEVVIWSNSFNAAGIHGNMNRRLTGQEGGLVALYHGDEISGTLLADLSGHGNDGTLQNSVSFGTSQARIQGLAQLRGRVTSAGVGFPNIQVSALLPPISAPPLLPIPDNAVVTSTNTVTLAGTIASMRVNVNISHAYRGDLELTLIHPDGTEIRLKDSDGADADPDVNTSYPDLTKPVESLAALNGKPIAGNWRLRVRDQYFLDSGILNLWSLQFGPPPVLTDANGYYVFSNLVVGTYNLEPLREGFVFTPPSQATFVDRTNVDFAVLTGFISGRVRDNTIGEAGVTISAGPGLSTTTAADGTYRLLNLPPGNKTITAVKSGYAISPGQRPNIALGTTNADFQIIGYPISGRIVDVYSNGVSGVSVFASSASVPGITDNEGNYFIPDALGGLVIITPFKSGVTFAPEFRTRNLGPAQSNVNFTAILSAPTITTIPNQVISVNGTAGPLRFDVNDAETAPARLQVTGTSSNPTLVPDANIVIDGVGVQRTVVVRPATNQYGTAFIYLTVTDESGLSTNNIFSLRVNQVPMPGVGLALNFDGINDVANGPVNAVLEKGDYSVEAWASAPSNSGPRTLISIGSNLTIGLNAAGQIRAGTNWNTGVPWPFGGWHHVALVRTTNSTRLYLDGVLRTNLNTGLQQPSAQSPLQVGALGTSEYWLGAIDEVRVWREARSASQIADYRTVRVTGNEYNLGGLWRFDDNNAPVASNSVPSGGNLSVSGATRIPSPIRFDRFVTFLGRNINDSLPAYDADGDPLVWSLVSPALRGTISLLSSNINGAFLYLADGLGEDQFTFSVTDGQATSGAYPISLLILPDTNAPVLSFLPDQTIAEDTVLGPIPLTVGDAERAVNLLPVFGICSNPTLVPSTNITISGNGTNRTLTLRPGTNQFGTGTVMLILSDGTHQTTNSFLLTVTPINDPPVLSVLTNQIVTRGELNFGQPFTFYDVDTPPESLVLKAQANNSLVSTYGNYPNGDAGVFRFTESGTNARISATSTSIASGASQITLTVDDGEFVVSRSHTVIVNDPPFIMGTIPNQSTFRNIPTAPIAITLNDVDDSVNPAVLSGSSSNPSLVDSSGFSFSGSGSNRVLVITPVGDRIGQATITVTASDAYHSSSQSFQLFVEGGLDYEIVVLPHLPGADRSMPLALNESGKIVGWSAIGTSPRAVVWDVNGVTPTVTALFNSSSIALSINNSGEIVGRNNDVGFRYHNGVVTTILEAAGTRCGLVINEGGDMVGGAVGASVITYLNGSELTKLTNTFLPSWFAGEQRNFALNDVGDLFGMDTSGTRALVWMLLPDQTNRTLIDLGVFSSSVHPLVGGINNVGQICINNGSTGPGIYNYRTATMSTNLQWALGGLGSGFPFTARDMNDSGEVVGGSGLAPAFLYADGRAFLLSQLMRSSPIFPSEARAINAFGDIVGYGSGVTPFLLRRRWYVGQPQLPPLQAINSGNGKVFRPPAIRAVDGTTQAELAQAYIWSDFEQKLFFLRPIDVEVSWFTSANVLDTNAMPILRRGRVIWPATPQIHIAEAPADATPVDLNSPYRPVALAYSTAPGATFDPTTKTFNSPAAGYSVIRYMIAPGTPLGATPDILSHSNYFEVVRTYTWPSAPNLIGSQSATVGTKVTDPRGPAVSTNSFKSGWTLFSLAPYDGVGPERAYDRASQTGPIIPVNRDTGGQNDDLVVAFYKKNSLTSVLWPDLPVRFSISWPTNAQKLVFADSDGSGPLPESQYADKRIYNQPNTNLPGFNPNEEHAFLAPTTSGQGVFALRNDLNRPDTSEPFVLLKYRNPTNDEWSFKVFQPVLTDATHVFTYNGDAGQELQRPNPVGFFTICDNTTLFSGQAFRDHQGKFYGSAGPTPLNLNPEVVMRYWYPLQPGFFYDRNGDGTNDVPVGQCVSWNSIPPNSSVSQPVDVTYRIRWPADAPILQIGETLLTPKHELPGIKDWASAQVVFDSLNPLGGNPLTNSARLYDPLSARVLRLASLPFLSASYQFPAEIALKDVGGRKIFSDLPYHLRSRLSYDPANRALSFQGVLNENVVGEPLLLLNVLSDKERLRIKDLSAEPDFRRIIDALYHLTRNPNGVNVARPGETPPDQALLIGFTTKYTVWVTNVASTNIMEFFGTRPSGNNIGFISNSIVQEPLGDAPKALSAGLPVPPSTASFGQALNFTGNGYVSLPSTTFNFPTSGTDTTPLTFECWFKTTGSGVILGQQVGIPPGSVGGYVPAVYVGLDGRLRAEVFWRGQANPITTTNAVNDGNFHHVAVVYNGQVESLYLDGKLIGSIAHTQISYGASYNYQLGVGYSPNWPSGNGGWFYFNGQLDDVRFWNVARTTNQLQAARGLPLTGGETGLVGYWRFDEPSGTVARDNASMNDGTIQNPNSVSRVASTVPVSGNAPRYMVIAENNDPALGSLPVTLHVIAVNGGPFRGDLKIILPDNVFDERLTLRHSSDFGAEPDRLEFEWWYHPADADFDDPTQLPTLKPDGSIDDPKGWFIYSPALSPNKNGQNTITIGDGNETSQFTLADNWFISRYRGYNIGGVTNWSDWVGDPSSSEKTRAMLAEGWIKRVVQGLGFFEARTTNFHDAEASTYSSMIIQAGKRYEGDIAFNPSPENLLGIGLIEAYTTVLNRGKKLSIDGFPPIDSDPLNNALLLAASRISDLYMLVGNEAFADAQDPTIGFFSDSLEFGTLATATYAFKNQLDSLLEEEMTLLRGRDDSAAGVGGKPVYNRLLWNFTGSDGEVAYERTYNIGDINLDGLINENDAKILFPQGHGDAWGHYLTAIKIYYELLRHPRFTWVPRTENVLVAGTAVRVDFQDERKFVNAAAAKAKAGSEIVDLTYRSKYVDDPEGQYQGYKDTRADRAWGVTEWARRAGQGAYFDWLVGNAILPSTDPNASHVGIQKIDRQTVQELDQIISEHHLMQSQLDKSDAGLNPLGLAKGAVPFDIDPSLLVPVVGAQAVSHFEQIYDRAVRAMNNCVTIWNQANQLSEALRRQQDDVDDFTANVADQERDLKSRLIEVFGYPYAGDIGAGKTYPSGYDGPDLYHWMYVNTTDLTGAASVPTNIMNGFFAPFTDGAGAPNYYFTNDLSVANTTVPGPILNVQFPLAGGSWAFAAPANFGSRRAPGELQLAVSDLLQEETRLKIALGNYDALIKNIQDQATLLQSRSVLSNRVISLLSSNNTEQARLNTQIQHAQNSQLALRRISDIVTRTTETLLETVPTDPGEAIFIAAKAVRAGILVAALVVSEAMETAADISEGVQNQYEKDKENVQLSTDLQAEILSQDYEIKQQSAELLAMMRDEATLRLEAFNQAELVKQSYGRLQAAVAAGERLVSERVVFRQRTAALTQQNRYKDMAFRVFRNEALQKYRAQFDLAARFVYLAASAYDYELNFLGSDNRAGRDFFTDIIRQRTIGQMLDGSPIAGSSGLADSLGRLKQNFEVLQPRFGLNNPQLETAQFSLRKELLRIRDNSDDQWRAILRQAVVQNLWDVPEFRRYCRPFAPESAGPQMGLVLRFPTTITFGLNFFGFPLGGGETAYDASLFSTKINAVGVWFSDYNGSGLATAPRVYLVPAGMDVQRSPTGNSLATREWRILDQVIPVPFPIGAGDLTDPTWIPQNDSLAESFGQIRRFSSFRAYHDSGDFDPAETTVDTRLIGRSVWNTDWILIIPGGTFLFNAEQGLETFIDSVSDIKLSLQSYSYSGD